MVLMFGGVRSIHGKPGKNTVSTVEATSDGLRFRRFFTAPARDPLAGFEWSSRSAVIRSESGETIFEQSDVEAPAFWSDMAVNVVVSRYFRGTPGTSERESSVKSLILRVADTVHGWGSEQGFFASEEDAAVFRDELIHLLVHQKASFNSPVWFNVGVEETPQCSACFILSVEDTMGSILDWYKREGLIFKGGSGSGVNLSRLRSAKEPLGGGGTASGPVSFMRAADASAGVIKSGGKTRRAAKMVILDVEHPDIAEFIRCKAEEEAKAKILEAAGYGGGAAGEEFLSVAFQNSNHSVRLTDAFMEADKNDGQWSTRYILSGEAAETFRARAMMHEIARAAHACGDPGIQFHTTINRWHTCPEAGPIRASNPCSEYMHLDDSACNLASLKLTAFMQGDLFRADAFRHAVDVMVTAQEILIDRAGYPTSAIAENSRRFRALGLGYADLGALLMGMGLPYDSDRSRALASAVTSLMTAESYVQSARMARVQGPFEEFEANRDAMLGVIDLHRRHSTRLGHGEAPSDLAAEALATWDLALETGREHGFRNCQTTVLAPTGTIAFMMDCDTTGIEPEMALVKYKKLAEGGQLKIVNKTVERALEHLGYPPVVAHHIVAKIEATGSIEGLDEVEPEHLPVFDCAFRPLRGKRFIAPEGHLRMMAAVQPFISGAISKTINLPDDTTVERIEEVFRLAWRLGLKAVTVYRDGCKSSQPLHLHEKTLKDRPRPERRRLSVDCRSERHKFEVAGQKGYIHTGFYDDGKLGEIFIRMAKEGSTISGLMDTIATLTSIALQYGVPLEALVNKFSHVRFEPAGFTKNPEIPMAKSLTDYIFRYLGTRYLDPEQQEAAGIRSPDSPYEEPPLSSSLPRSAGGPPNEDDDEGHAFNPQSDAPACYDCGAIMVRNGSCYRCLNCGATNGCS
jgi:ribonucleoside-diphosphate reductase alpha chain